MIGGTEIRGRSNRGSGAISWAGDQIRWCFRSGPILESGIYRNIGPHLENPERCSGSIWFWESVAAGDRTGEI